MFKNFEYCPFSKAPKTTKSSMSVASSVFPEIRSQSRKKGFTLQDIIEDLDDKGNKTLSTIKFRRLFNLLGIWLDENKAEKLISEYRIQDSNLVDCNRFLDDYEHPQENSRVVTDEQLREFGKSLIIRNTTIAECIRPYDRFHSGHVNLDSFFASFGYTPINRLIAQQYSHPPTNDVYYLDLANDVEKILKEKPLRETTLNLTMSKLPPYFKDIAKTIRLNQVDPYQMLSQHDKLKKSTILPCHFMADASRLGLRLNERQLNEITEAFSENNRFDYVSFCDAIKAENEIELKEIQTQRETIDVVPPEPPVDINELLKRIEGDIKIRHSLIGDRLEHFDQFHTGVLLDRQFFKILENERFVLTDPEKLALIDEFADGQGNMNYKAFIMAVVPPQQSIAPVTNSIIERLKEHLAEHKLCLRPLFEKLDASKLGYISFNQLLSIFRNIQFDIDIKERRALRAETTDRVSMEEFCTLVDPILEPATKPVEEEEEPEPEIPEKNVMDALARMASIIEYENIDLAQEFQRFDNSRQIKPSQFKAALIQLPDRLPDSDIDLFAEIYLDKKSRLIDTPRFIKDINTYGNDQLKLSPDLSVTTTTKFVEPNSDTKSILRRLKVILTKKNLQSTALFRPYDPGNIGYVSHDRVHSIFSYIGFQIAPNDLKQLETAFQSSRMPDQFNYKRMLVTLEELEIQSSDFSTVPVIHSNSNFGEYALVNLTNTLHSKLQARRKSTNCVFYGCPDAPIPVSEFRERISNYGLIITQADAQLLIRSYRANMNGDIDWKRFCEDVDTIRTVQPPR
ncbi:EF hand family protein [Tritrichomonas foetus]|uniref:EF hand family protein n=1 Tax=Tritrichomonas foetus TaxID=1144522 RepID=A0A1J4JVD5_9EUKA|nr:EF hand family protein [Tritrichomonas foetus]|eukprot:OHT03119.1 EF hand family protein [Tritrichomonas foetus]